MTRRTLAEWLRWQEALHPRSIDLGLARVRGVARRLDVLDFDCPVITVAGTNGKGSCVALLESMLGAGGYRVGAFTSPHLIHYNERIRIAGRHATDEELVEAFEEIDAARGEVSLTFFEFNTLAALLLFKRAALDALVLEVGLGGRLDAVNMIDADVALITTIGLDHCDWLGDTREAIGREKAGVFRPGRSAVLGSADMPPSVFDAARDIGARLRIADPALLAGLPPPALRGAHQTANAAAALTVLDELRERLPLRREHLAQGLRQAAVPGRFQVLEGDPEWIFDVAHNPDAAAVLAGNLDAHLARAPRAGRVIAIVGVLADKDIAGVFAPLLPRVDVWIVTALSGARSLDAATTQARSGAPVGGAQWLQAASVEAACELATKIAAPGDRIVVFGSFLTVGPALQWKGAMLPFGPPWNPESKNA